MRQGVPTTSKPDVPTLLYMRCMYHTFWFGPFADEQAVADAIKLLDAADPYWDYDCFCIHYGVVDMKDVVNDPVYVSSEVRKRIESQREPSKR